MLGGLSLLALGVVCFTAGMVPVNRGFVPVPDDAPGVDVWVVSNAVHADVVLPLVVPIADGDVLDWRDELPAGTFPALGARWPPGATHVAFGWGDRGFFLHTPAWRDLRPATAMRALAWPSPSVMHVTLTRPDLYDPAVARRVRVSPAAYRRLADAVRAGFAADAGGRWRLLPGAGYGEFDAFFAGAGRYHLLRNCNTWAGATLRAAGVPVPWWTLVPGTVAAYLP